MLIIILSFFNLMSNICFLINSALFGEKKMFSLQNRCYSPAKSVRERERVLITGQNRCMRDALSEKISRSKREYCYKIKEHSILAQFVCEVPGGWMFSRIHLTDVKI